ncbi:hypothetical protein ISF_06857 [Cordyceps fumosorosea ARSEF 2679]|uniref:Uncharacterized protein n=1 Tax=Cordyceps fumosorosea (strain ARSEF 2679) TaxID=1081104 RepID=A0A167R6L3_CORFA|nr:hypothetical protein ISF_06857 [Cordyceps fumosorosea ARSEF 2679]OAA58318.1 hypothetical protein ISF_06857 [Cordyceps fumosorosea ARSEF 2679]
MGGFTVSLLSLVSTVAKPHHQGVLVFLTADIEDVDGLDSGDTSITVNEQLRIWLHDRYSTHRTAISHEQNKNFFNKDETWILASAPDTQALF